MWNNIKTSALKQHQTATKCSSNRKVYQKSIIDRMIENSPGTCTAECQIIIDSHISQLNNIAEIIESEPQTYNIDMDNESQIPCPVFQCPYNATKRHQMRSHFRNMHNIDTIIIIDDMICTVFGLRTVLPSQRILLCPRHITKYWYKR
jgi:hypothetical protein